MILVTGGSGLLGEELITQLLLENKKVKAIYNKSPIKRFDNPNLIYQQCDILDVVRLEEIMADVDEVYHCAGLVSYSPKDEINLYKINVEGTANIVNAALNKKVKKLVHVSSIAALGRKRTNLKKDEKYAVLITESMEWESVANNNYGKSKYLGELEVWRGIAEGLNAVIVNPSLILGAGDWNNSSTAIFKKAYTEFAWYAEGETGFVDVQDVAKAMRMLMQSDVTGQRFIISAQNESFKTIFSMIAGEFKKQLPYKKVTPFLAGLVWRLEAVKAFFTGSVPLITKETSITALTVSNFDNTKFKNYFPGFEYKKIETTIKNVCEVLQQRVNIH